MATIAEALDVADRYQRAGHWREAEHIYRQIVQMDPNQARAQYGMAGVCLSSHRVDEAVSHLRHTLRLEPNNSEAQRLLGAALQRDSHHAFKGETSKAAARRSREGWFEKFAPEWMSGIDIGCQDDFLNQTFRRWDYWYGDPDATFMQGVPDNIFQTVYASHLLEHLDNPVLALQNWYRITRQGGHMIVIVPHRDLYEKRKELPSMWNNQHRTFWIPETGEPPSTRGLRQTILEALPKADIVLLKVRDEGYIDPGPGAHAQGEFSIEAIVRKP